MTSAHAPLVATLTPTAQGEGASPSAEPGVVRSAIDEILAGPEFNRGETLFSRFAHWIRDVLVDLLPDGLISPATLAELARAIVWILLGAVFVILAWVVIRSLRSRIPRTSRATPESAAVSRAERVRDLRSAARAADARGEYVLALRLEFTALVVGLGERGDLEYREAFTNRELLERGKPGRHAESLLRPLVPELDRKSFGGEAATHADFARLATLCDGLLKGTSA